MWLLDRLARHSKIALIILALGGVATLILDNMDSEPATPAFWTMFVIAFALRVPTYVIFFASFPLLASALRENADRWRSIAIAWFLGALTLVLANWIHLATVDAPYYTDTTKRFAPGTEAGFAPGWTMVEVALGRDRAKLYGWVTAISAEVIAILIISLCMALYLRRVSALKARYAYLTPVVGVALLLTYWLLVPWSYVFDFDIFIGDGLLGTAIDNVIMLPFTILAGGFTSPALWIGVIAATNILLARKWS